MVSEQSMDFLSVADFRKVLILVLVEDGLGVQINWIMAHIITVLILVLVEDGLGVVERQRQYQQQLKS